MQAVAASTFPSTGLRARLGSRRCGVSVAFVLQQFLRDHHSHALLIKLGRPWENPSIGSFNDTFRAECWNRRLDVDGQEAQTIIEQWRQEYLMDPHRSLGCLPLAAFAKKSKLSLQLDWSTGAAHMDGRGRALDNIFVERL